MMNFLRRHRLELYLVLLSIQLLYLAYYSVKSIPIPIPHYEVFQGVGIYFNYSKRIELAGYFLSIVYLGTFFLLVLFVETKMPVIVKRHISAKLLKLLSRFDGKDVLISLLVFFVNPILIFSFNRFSYSDKLLVQLLNFYIALLFPLTEYLYKYELSRYSYVIKTIKEFRKTAGETFSKVTKYFNSDKSILNKRWFYIGIFLVVYLQLIAIFFEPIFFKPKIFNEYLNVPEVTLLADKTKLTNVNFVSQSIEAGEKDELKDHLWEWKQKNLREFRSQVMSRYIIHHYSFIFNPINELKLGKNFEKIHTQYGGLNVVISEKFFSLIGGITLHGMMKATYLFYYLYFIFFIIIVYSLTRNIVWSAAIFLMAVALINIRGYESLMLAPGESPWRNFLDIFVLYSLYLYIEKKRFVFYLSALLLGLVAVAVNPQIGFMMVLAVVVSGLFYAFRGNVFKTETQIASISTLLVGIILFRYSSHVNVLSGYYMDGMIGFPISFSQMFIALLAFVFCYVLLYKIVREKLSNNYLYMIFLLVYSQGLFFYAVWHFNVDGLTSRGYIYALTVLLIIFPFYSSLKNDMQKSVKTAVVLLSGTIYAASVISLCLTYRDYNKIFSDHMVFDWNTERVKIISTANPKYFSDAVFLIQKYTPDDNGIYIVSEYDNILPFMAGKYSLMPFFDLKWYLVTPKELAESKQVIKEARPRFVYVDTRINDDIGERIIKSGLIATYGFLPYYREMHWRSERIGLLHSIFKEIQNDYVLIEKGDLISVYKRKE